MRTIAPAAVAAVSLLAAAAAGPPPDDTKPAAMRACGVREAAALSPTEIRVVLGAASTPAAGAAEAWRILSDTDPAYAWTSFVRPVSVRKIADADEFPLPPGDASPAPAKHAALGASAWALELPSPMKDGATYTAIAHGAPSMRDLLVTGGRADASFVFRAGGPFAAPALPPPDPATRASAGVRGLWSVGGGVVRLECGAALAPPACDDPAAYEATLDGAPVAVRSVGRRSVVDAYKPVGWPFKVLLRHDVFLDLGAPLAAGDRVRVAVSPAAIAAGACAEAELAFDEKTAVSDSIKANQAGYLPDAPKEARLGRWLGTMPAGALDSFLFAGCAAQAARVLRATGKGGRTAALLLLRARKAWDWAEANPPPEAADPKRRGDVWRSPRAYAAAHLLAATGETRFGDAFAAEAPWGADPAAPVQKDGAWDLREAAFAYVRCVPADKADPALRDAAKAAIVRDADAFLTAAGAAAYPFVRHPWAPVNWGTGAYENFLPPVVFAWAVTGEAKYRDAIVRTCDNTLGCNPMSICWTTGFGPRRIHAPLHNSRYAPGGPVAGLQAEGPVASGKAYNWPETAVPAPRADDASLYTFSDCHFAIGMDEGLVASQARTLAAFGLLLPDAAP